MIEVFRDFLVSIAVDCPSVTLTPSTSLFLEPPASTLQQYVGYAAKTLEWTDADVTPSIGFHSPDPCGTL